MEFLKQTENVNSILDFIKIFFISLFTYYVSLKIINKKNNNEYKKILICLIYILFVSLMYIIIKQRLNFFYSTLFLVFLLSIMLLIRIKKDIIYSIFITLISLSINYILLFIAVFLSFVPNAIFNVKNNVIGLTFLLILYTLILNIFLKTKKIKNGLIFLQVNASKEHFNLLVLNISIYIVFLVIMLDNYNNSKTDKIGLAIIIFSIIMFITIQKSLQLYYKQKLLEQELNETKDELEKKKEEVKQLETENLKFSKTSHTLAHKQKSLEYKLEQLKQKYEIAEEIEIEDRIKDISKEIYNKTPEVELSKTGILEIDDMLKYMQSECIKNNIEFRLQIKGNIYEMINNYISKEDLSILIADHVKNAIIAINYSENINKSILVRLGKINKIYSLYIYDSGIEFEKETLSNLGKIPSTTHADNGGTGMGFMNTFDTLRKYNASLIINEYNKPSNDNYTKSIVIKLDKRNEFTINSYKDKINN